MRSFRRPFAREAKEFHYSRALCRQLGGYVRAEAQLLALSVLAMLAATTVTLARPWPMQVIVDSVLGSRPAPGWITGAFGVLAPGPLLVVATGLMVAALLLGHILVLTQGYVSQLLGQRMVLRLRCDLYARLQRLSLRFHDRSSVGDLIHRITGDAAALQDIVTYGVVPVAVHGVTALAVTAIIFLLDVRLGLAALAMAPVLVGWTFWFSERVRRRSRRLATAESGLYTAVSETLGAIRAVKSFATEALEARRFERHARSSQEAYVRVMTLSALGGLVTEALAGLGAAAVVFFGARAVLGGELSIGELLVFVAYVQSLYGPVTDAASSAMVVQRSAASIERVVQILDQEDEYGRGDGLRPARVVGAIAYRGVSLSYDDGRPALRDITLDVGPGERVAFVGASGAGKTSLVSLLLRFYRPQAGHIRLDGVDIEQLDLEWLRRHVALVLQEPIIFSGTLGENIRYGRPDATVAEVVAASLSAGLDEFVRTLPDGYDTEVGERGVRLSGGQRQRLSIARAFLKDAPILILDEPTSNLDATTERHVFESLDRLTRGRTTLVISHRLATAQLADRIVVLADGRLVEEGTHAALLGAGRAYALLYEHQMAAGRRPAVTSGPARRPEEC